MLDLEEQLRAYAEHLVNEDRPVTPGEVRRRARRPVRDRVPLLLAAAAAVLVVAGISAVVLDPGDDGMVTTTDQPGGFALDLDGHRNWMLALLNGDIEPDDDEIADRFAPEFLESVPAGEVRRIAESVTTAAPNAAPWSVLTVVERRDRSLAVQLVGTDGQQARLTVAVERDGQLSGATILFPQDCAPLHEPGSVDVPPGLATRLDWVVDAINSDRVLDDGELRDVFSETFLAEQTPDQLRDAIADVRVLAPVTLRWIEGEPTATTLTARVGLFTGEEARLQLDVSPDASHRIDGVSVLTVQPCELDS